MLFQSEFLHQVRASAYLYVRPLSDHLLVLATQRHRVASAALSCPCVCYTLQNGDIGPCTCPLTSSNIYRRSRRDII
jgi:hypothetical protein